MANVIRSGMCPKSEEGLIFNAGGRRYKSTVAVLWQRLSRSRGVIKELTDVYSDCLIGLGSEVHKIVDSLKTAVPQHHHSSLLIYNIYQCTMQYLIIILFRRMFYTSFIPKRSQMIKDRITDILALFDKNPIIN